ncbi:MAG: hypothetical protein ACKO6E_06525, partial [Planctomycetota bacterium]
MNPPIRSPLDDLGLNLTRRRFFEQGSHLLGGAALAALGAQERSEASPSVPVGVEGVPTAVGPH